MRFSVGVKEGNREEAVIEGKCEKRKVSLCLFLFFSFFLSEKEMKGMKMGPLVLFRS